MLANSSNVTSLAKNALRTQASPTVSIAGRVSAIFVKRQSAVISRADSAIHAQSALHMQNAEHKVLG